jgi:hypothetical protein
MEMDSEDAKIVAGIVMSVSLPNQGVSMEMATDRKNRVMWSGMNRSDGAYEKVIHGKPSYRPPCSNIRGANNQKR